ncbi:MAG TPA: AgmX/PglI C-terminal domain-containing protein [Kofleriaceae bacterium]|nr:AgmX/PglI C-terminal domain-containing protein [Kofleriaceae bacterium]
MSDINLPEPNPTHPASTKTAVEVVATFGDTVVGVQHRTDPHAGRVSRMTRALLVGGALSVAGALGGFVYAAKLASDDAALKEQEIKQGRPEWWHRPKTLPQAADVGFSLAATLGLGALAWGLARRRDERQDARVRIGTAANVDFPAPASPSTSFDLIAPAGEQFMLRLAGGLTADGISAPEVPVTMGMRTRVRCGDVTFHVAGVPAPAKQPTPVIAAIDRRVASYFMGSVVAHAAILMLLRAIPPEASTASADLDSAESVSDRYRMVAIEDQKKIVTDGESSEDGEKSNTEGTSASMQLPGTQGTPETHSTNPAKTQIARNREEAIENARRIGVNSEWEGQQLAMITGSDDLQNGADALDLNGAYDGSPDGEGSPWGSWGRGRHGTDVGGDLIVAGDYNTIRGGRPGGDDFHIGGGGHCATGHVCHGHDPVAPPVKIGPPVISDDNVGPVIQRYIKRYRDRIGYCYEKALLGNPNLEGTVNSAFVISANGAVLSSTATGVSDEVSSCVAEVIHSIPFPKLAESGTFQIKYPFILHKPNNG